MRFFSVILLGIAANLDNLCIGMSSGLSGRHIKLSHNLLISCISGVFAFAACAAAALMSQGIARYAQCIGAALLMLIGLHTVISALKKKSDECEKQKNTASRELRARDTAVLGVALAINSLACSFAAGLSEIQPLPLGISITLLSLMFISFGNALGGRILALCSGKVLDVISGLILIATGVFQILM